MLFMSLSVVKLILIRWFIWEAPFKCKELCMSHRPKAAGPYVRLCVFCRNNKSSHMLYTSELFSLSAQISLPHFQGEKKKKNHTSVRHFQSTADVLWTMSLKPLRLWPVLKMPSYPGVGKHLLESRRLCEGKEDLEVSWKDKETCMKTSSPKTAGNLLEWGLGFIFHRRDGQTCT